MYNNKIISVYLHIKTIKKRKMHRDEKVYIYFRTNIDELFCL